MAGRGFASDRSTRSRRLAGGKKAPGSSCDRETRGRSRGRGVGPPRHLYLDNLKVLLIAAIIVTHAVLGYASIVDVRT